MGSLHRYRGHIAAFSGLALQALQLHLSRADDLPTSVVSTVGLISAALCVYGSTVVAESKGYTPWLGLGGLFSFVGVGLVFILPRRDSVRSKKAQDIARRYRESRETPRPPEAEAEPSASGREP